MKATVNEALCTGCGICEYICPEVFHLEDGIAEVKVITVPQKAEKRCIEAMDECPTNAITIQQD